jgi:hypothetical protein
MPSWKQDVVAAPVAIEQLRTESVLGVDVNIATLFDLAEGQRRAVMGQKRCARASLGNCNIPYFAASVWASRTSSGPT